MITISLCMIVKDEEKNLAHCLESICSSVDEIIIVDTGSTDKTKEIAYKYTDFVYDFKWGDNFADARNFSFSKATQEYIMWLDADDIILEEEQAKLLVLKEKLDLSVDVVFMKYKVPTSLKEMTKILWRERLVKRGCQFKWHNPVHEYINYKGKCKSVDITICHTKQYTYTRRNLDIYEKYMEEGNKLNQWDKYYYAGELMQEKQVDKAILFYEDFLKSKGELKSNYLDASIKLASCYKYKKEEDKCLKALLTYLELDGPRAEICCQLGYYYKEKQMYEQAILWFEIAPATHKPIDDMGGLTPLCWDYIPYMELCACYYKKGDIEKAIYFNEKAAQINPQDEMVLHNRIFLAVELEKQLKSQK